MPTRFTTCTITAIALLFVLGLVMPAPSDAQNLRRLAADYQVGEIATDVADYDGGVKVYSKVISTASQNDTLYVTVIGTSDLHDGTHLSLGCKLDGANCQPNFGDWTRVQKIPRGGLNDPNCNDGGGGPGDCHDNSFIATWCFGPLPSVPQNLRTVEIWLASGDSGSYVFYQQATIYIDASRTIGACTAPADAG